MLSGKNRLPKQQKNKLGREFFIYNIEGLNTVEYPPEAVRRKGLNCSSLDREQLGVGKTEYGEVILY